MHLALACFCCSGRWPVQLERGKDVRKQTVDKCICEAKGDTEFMAADSGAVPVGGMHGGGGAEICCDAHICDILGRRGRWWREGVDYYY